MTHTFVITRSIAALALTALFFDAPSKAQTQDGPPPAMVRTAEIIEQDMSRTITTPASVTSRNDARISAQATGRIIFIAEPGDFLEAGDLIAQMDDREAQIMLDEARARRARVTANAEFQIAEADRLERLTANGTVAATRLRDVVLARDLAILDQRESRLAVARAELELERTRIVSPFSGRVAERLIQVGELSSPGREIARLVDTESKEAIAQAPVAIAPFLAVGQSVVLSTGSGDSLIAPIRAIIPVGNSVSRTFEVRIDLAGSNWVVGSAARAAFPAETPRRQLAAPYDAVVLRSNGAFVFTVDDDNVAHQVPVVAGVRLDGLIAIEGDISLGQRVVVSGAETLAEGQTVQELGEDA
jgi:RND family efflux transporter MFP subunit